MLVTLSVRPEVNIPLADALEQATPYWIKAEELEQSFQFQESEVFRRQAMRLVAKILNDIDGFDR
ncbi:MAG: hypothetical protein IPM23_09610 [Candidatus Melainabacteria bacterium]|jgi:hypothetical protein|nr:hypothetical protein [Candidatus Melainabacteria bacterium]